MKKLTILFLAASFINVANAQKKAVSKTVSSTSDIKQSIKDDGKTLHISIYSNKAGKKQEYDHVFEVAGLSKKQKNDLVKHVTDSLGFTPPPAPPAPHKMGK